MLYDVVDQQLVSTLPTASHAASQACHVQVYLQELAWTEENKPACVARRADHAAHAAERSLLTEAPMFCFQTALALHRWSCLAYMGVLPSDTPCPTTVGPHLCLVMTPRAS